MPGDVTVQWGDAAVRVAAGTVFSIGRTGDLVLDDNPHLHRRLLQLHTEHGLWWLSNVGSAIAVTVGTDDGHFQAQLGPGAAMPVVVPHLRLVLTAGARSYDLGLECEGALMTPSVPRAHVGGDATRQPLRLTESQRLLVTALAEPALLRPGGGLAAIPASADVAARLGWPLTTFNRKLDAVCEKLDRAGVEGLRGGPGQLASNRRARLVEYALVSRLVSADDLAALDASSLHDPADDTQPGRLP
ncbi:hypothetical protein [Demequina sp. NBRC 110057]|uniref:hypothetical protein n=1 Tax=Demequina sp. NBRC 110057 TaxID=1570346 RepID=UPI0009FCDC6D|nr:hypothetical protein [Demequina sp. NBRC 110057]